MNLHRRPGRLLRVCTVVPAVSLALLVSACGSQTAGPGAVDTSPTEVDSTPVEGSPLTTAGLQTGPAPKIGYAVSGKLVLPDGGGFRLPEGTFEVARLGDLTVTMQSGPSDSQPVSILDSSGKAIQHDNAVGGGLAVNPDSDVIAWMGLDDHPRILDQGGTRIVDLPDVAGGRSLVDVAGKLDCQEGGAGLEGGCTVLVNTDAGEHRAWVSSSHGIVDWAGPLIHGIAFLPGNKGGILGYTSLTDDGSCSGLWRSEMTLEWKTCDWRLLSPSADGKAIIAGSAYADGLGDGELAFLDSNGRMVHAWTPGGATVVSTPQWEDSQHALAVVFDDDQWSIVRFGTDGSMEYAVPPQAGTDLDNPFLVQST